MILTYKYRIKDATSRKKLTKLASSVNFVWNYINNLSYKFLKQHNKFLSAFDIDKYLAGAASELSLHSTSLQEVSKVYTNNRKTFKKTKLACRSAKRNTLGWIPFKASAIKMIADDTIKYKNLVLKFYKSRLLPKEASIKTGSFSQDSRGRWYVNLVVDVQSTTKSNDNAVGIDLGLKDKIALSNGETFSRENVSKKFENKLAAAQRANKKKLVKSVSAKIKNIRKDWTHKITTQIAKQFANVYVGDLSSTNILGEAKNINKSIYDTALYQIKSFLQYKAVKLGGKCSLINESYTTQKCSACGTLSGPKGKEELDVREWACACGASHNRDTNAAINILRIGHYTP